MSRTVVELLEAGMSIRPDAIALTDATSSGSTTMRAMTHGELDGATARLAAQLIDRGIGRGHRVAVAFERSSALIVSVLAVLRSGAAYVPIDPDYPPERVHAMLAGSAPSLVLTTSEQQQSIGAEGFGSPSAPTLFWEQVAASVLGTSSTMPAETGSELDRSRPDEVRPNDDAYVIFTSGSTGRPKGVQMPHRALANLIDWQMRRETFAPAARVLQYSSISFDVSFQEIASTIASGGELVLVDDELRRDPRRLLKALADHRIERLHLPFVALRSLVEAASALPPDLREVITAGEQLRVDDAMRRAFGHGCRLDNQYGPSETHVITAHQLPEDSTAWPNLPPIGTAIDGCHAVVLDDEMSPVERGAVGELFLGGVGLAHGYLDMPDRTAEAFVADPDNESARLYRTGDSVHVDRDGQIHFVGRADQQVKIRGHRVEPGEVSAAASRFPGVAQCLTHAFETSRGSNFLVTYVTASDVGESLDTVAVREWLAEQLPPYLVPAFVVPLESIPLGPSGKADVARLPDPRQHPVAAPATFATDTERRVVRIWTDVLEFPTLPAGASFFDLGGDSLAAVSLFLRITEEFGVELPLSTVTTHPTVPELAAAIEQEQKASGESTEIGFRALQLLGRGAADVPPLVLVHGGGGNVLMFAELAAQLAPEQTVVAFQWPGWDGGDAPRSIPEMAAAYAEELLRFAPTGPYRLGGHCIGGLIALELAELLRANGHVIDGPLIVSDAPNLGAASHRTDDPAMAPDDFEAIRHHVFDAVPSTLRTGGWRGSSSPIAPLPDAPELAKMDPIRRTLHRYPKVRNALIEGRRRAQVAAIRAMVKAKRTVPHDQRLLHCTSTMIRAARRHTPRRFNGDVVYFRSSTFEGREMALPGWWDDLTMGFDELVGGTIDVHVVGGEHDAPLSLAYSADVVRRSFMP